MNRSLWRSRLLAAGWVLLWTAISFMLTRQVMEPAANLAAYQPILNLCKDPSLYPGDDYIHLMVQRIPTLVWRLASYAVDIENPHPDLLILSIGVRLCTLALAGWIAAGLARDKRAGMLAVVLFSMPIDTVLGRGDINWPYFTHTAVVIPVLLGSLGLLLRGRAVVAFALAGLAWNIHLLNAAYYSLFLAIWLALSARGIGRRKAVYCILAAAVCALPVAPRTIAGMGGEAPGAIWLEHSRLFYRQLLSPFEQPVIDWLRFACYLLLLIGMIRTTVRREEKTAGLSMTAMWAALYSAGYVFIELLPMPLFFKLQPFRCTDVFLLLFLPWFAGELVRGVTRGDLTRRAVHGGLFVLFCFFQYKVQYTELKIVFSVIWACAVLAKAWLDLSPERSEPSALGQLPRALAWGGAGYGLLLLLVYNPLTLVVLGAWLPDFRGGSSWLLSGVGLSILIAYVVLRARTAPVNWKAERLRIATLILLLLVGWETGSRIVGLTSMRYRKMNHLFYDRYQTAFFDAAHWCRVHTPPDALFIVPPYRGGFRAESLRSVYVSWDEQLALMVAPDYVPEYDRRLRMLGYNPFQSEESQPTWNPSLSMVQAVSDESGADYLVIEREKTVALPLVFQNSGYNVYRIR